MTANTEAAIDKEARIQSPESKNLEVQWGFRVKEQKRVHVFFPVWSDLKHGESLEKRYGRTWKSHFPWKWA